MTGEAEKQPGALGEGPRGLPSVLAELPGRSRSGVTASLVRVRGGLALALQSGVAAGLAWFIAHNLIGRPTPFFAPIAAVVCLGVSLGQRLRRVGELVVGVSVGVGVGDALISWIGSGPWQIALVVGLAMSAAVLLDGGVRVGRGIRVGLRQEQGEGEWASRGGARMRR